MPKYSIPSSYIKGFENIVKLTENDLTAFSKIISELEIGESLENVFKRSQGVLSLSSEDDIHSIVMSLISLVDIFEASNRDVDKFTTQFSEAYLESNPRSNEGDGEVLKNNLSVLLRAFDNIRITAKARNIIQENKNNFKKARILSDIRLVFDGDLDETEKVAVVIHNLKIDYTNRSKPKEFFVSLDLSDLKKMKDVIERAIEKDNIIRTNKHGLNFIDIQ